MEITKVTASQTIGHPLVPRAPSSDVKKIPRVPTVAGVQGNERDEPNIFDIPYYKMLEKYLQFLGQDPRQSNKIRATLVIIVMLSVATLSIPTLLEVYVQLCERDMNAVIECLPHLIASITSMVKLMNIYLHRRNFKKMFDMVAIEWKQLELKEDIRVLEELTKEGSKIANLYRNTLQSLAVVFLIVPLTIPILDVVIPLNETRQRPVLLRVNYIFFDSEEYFFYVYLQLAWAIIAGVTVIVTIDSLYILIIHHNSGLFAVCGYQLQKALDERNTVSNECTSENKDSVYQQFRNSIIAHQKAIQFFDLLNDSSRTSYLLQVGLNMMGISVTMVQTVVCLDNPEQAIRCALLLGSKQFHLFLISFPGQVLLDHCTEVANNIYRALWYNAPIKIQKMIYTMLMRSRKPCALSAGGLYEMNMENFGVTFKACMSYFTMIMSLRD